MKRAMKGDTRKYLEYWVQKWLFWIVGSGLERRGRKGTSLTMLVITLPNLFSFVDTQGGARVDF